MQLLFLLVVVIVLSSAGCGTTTAPTSSSDATAVRRPAAPISVSGRALDYVTNNPVANVAIAFGQFGASGFVAQASAVTSASGAFTLTIAPGAYLARAGDGFGSVHVNDAAAPVDFLVNTGNCVARYGTIVDILTGRAIAMARVQFVGRTATSDGDGWYRVDLGCGDPGQFGFGTTVISITHPDYQDVTRVVGRGVVGVERLDVWMGRR